MADSLDPLSDEALARAYRASRRPVGDHLSQEQWERLTCDELRGEDRDRALAHIESCGECTTIHRGLLDLRAQVTDLDAASVSPVPVVGHNRWSLAAGLAAAAALVAAVLINQPGRTTLSSELTRSGEAREAIAVVTPSADSALNGRRFEWQPVATATAYEIRVNAADGTALWSTRVAAPSVDLPADVVLKTGSYFWQVRALRDQAPIALSPIVAFRVN